MSCAALCLLLTAAEPAALGKARALLETADYEAVAEALAPLLRDAAAPSGARARGWVLLAVARHNLLDEPRAREAIREALALDPKVELPAGTSPRTVDLFQKEQAALPPPSAVSALEPQAVTAGAQVKASFWAPSRVGGAISAALALGAAGVGVPFTLSAFDGRARAIAQPDGLVSEQQFQRAQSDLRLGSTFLVIAAAAVVAAAVLFVIGAL